VGSKTSFPGDPAVDWGAAEAVTRVVATAACGVLWRRALPPGGAVAVGRQPALRTNPQARNGLSRSRLPPRLEPRLEHCSPVALLRLVCMVEEDHDHVLEGELDGFWEEGGGA
jgi:hypothetical protein